MDDFYIIASHHESNTSAANHLVSQTNTENHARGLKGFLRNITGTSSTAVASPSGTTSTSSRERASSRSRTPSSNNSSNISSKQHAPVKRVSVTSNLSQSLITNNELENQVQDSAGGSRKLSGINPGGTYFDFTNIFKGLNEFFNTDIPIMISQFFRRRKISIFVTWPRSCGLWSRNRSHCLSDGGWKGK